MRVSRPINYIYSHKQLTWYINCYFTDYIYYFSISSVLFYIILGPTSLIRTALDKCSTILQRNKIYNMYVLTSRYGTVSVPPRSVQLAVA